MSATAADPASVRPRRTHVPGEAGVWVFIGGDVAIFTALFATYLVYRMQAPASFAVGRATLAPVLGMTNTLVLLTGSLLMVTAQTAWRRGLSSTASRLVLATIGAAVVFSVIKVVEYTRELQAGVSGEPTDFALHYLLITGLHWFHLVVATGFLAVVAVLVRRPRPTPRTTIFIEGAACFWHMVDLLWIVIFPLLYLVP